SCAVGFRTRFFAGSAELLLAVATKASAAAVSTQAPATTMRNDVKARLGLNRCFILFGIAGLRVGSSPRARECQKSASNVNAIFFRNLKKKSGKPLAVQAPPLNAPEEKSDQHRFFRRRLDPFSVFPNQIFEPIHCF